MSSRRARRRGSHAANVARPAYSEPELVVSGARSVQTPHVPPPSAPPGEAPLQPQPGTPQQGGRAARRAPAPAPTRRQVERARRAERRRRTRRTALVAGAGVLVVALVAAVIVVLGGGSKHHKQPAATAGRTQHTLLVALVDGRRRAEGAALLAHDAKTSQGVVALVPPALVTEVPGHGTSSFGDAFSYDSPRLAADTLADEMTVTVDGVWAIDQPALAQLVDQLGGIDVDVDADVVQTSNGARQIVVPAGPHQHLTGVQAAAYAAYQGAGETESAELARLQRVLVAVLGVLPGNPGAVAAQIGGLPGGSVTTQKPSAFADLLVGLKSDIAAENAQFQVIPVKPIDTGDQQEHYDVDAVALSQFTHSYLAGSIPAAAAGGHNRVLVFNGVGTLGLGETARARLVAKQLVFVRSENEPGFAHRSAPSEIVIPDQSQQSVQTAQRVASSLGLPASDIKIGTQLDFSVADVIVILGDDYRP